MKRGRSDGRARRFLLVNHGAELYGSDRVFLETVRAVGEHADDLVVTMPSDGELAETIRSSGRRVAILNVPRVHKGLLSVGGLLTFVVSSARALVEQLRLIRRTGCDVIVVNSVITPSWLLAGRLARRRVICHVHEAERSVATPLRLALTMPLVLAHQIIVNSEFTRETISWPIRWLRGRTTLVYNGVPGPAEPTTPRTELTGGIRLLFVGRLSARKGPQVAVAALQRLVDRGADARLSLLGAVFPGYEWFEGDLRDQVGDAGLADRVRFLGFRPDIWAELRDHDIVLVPSTVDEPFGNTAVEAVLAHRPLVCSATSGLLEAAAGYETVRFAEPDDADSLAVQITRVIDDWQQLRGQVDGAAAEAIERHAPEAYRSAVWSVLQAG